MDHVCYLSLVFVMVSLLFVAALRSPAGKGMTSWLSFVMLNCVFVTFPCGFFGQVGYSIVSIPGLEVIKREYSLRLKIKRSDYLLADTCPQAANHCTLF